MHENSSSIGEGNAPHSSTLAWKIPWTEEPGRLQSMVSLRVGHNWATSLSLFTFTHWRRKWQPTPIFLPGESQRPGAWWAAVYGVAQSRTRLKRLSSSSSIAHWNNKMDGSFYLDGIHWNNMAQTVKSLQCRRPGFDPWVEKIPQRRKWLPNIVFLAGEFHGQRILAGYNWATNTFTFSLK